MLPSLPVLPRTLLVPGRLIMGNASLAHTLRRFLSSVSVFYRYAPASPTHTPAALVHARREAPEEKQGSPSGIAPPGVRSPQT